MCCPSFYHKTHQDKAGHECSCFIADHENDSRVINAPEKQSHLTKQLNCNKTDAHYNKNVSLAAAIEEENFLCVKMGLKFAFSAIVALARCVYTPTVIPSTPLFMVPRALLYLGTGIAEEKACIDLNMEFVYVANKRKIQSL